MATVYATGLKGTHGQSQREQMDRVLGNKWAEFKGTNEQNPHDRDEGNT